MNILDILSLISCLICLVIGYFKPRTSSYFVLLTTPILSPGRLVLIPSNTLPLEYIIFAFALSLGIALSPSFSERSKYFSLKSNKWIYGLIIMIIIMLLVSNDEYITTVLFLDIPIYFVGIIIPIFIINSSHDLKIFIYILVWQGALIGIFAILDYLEIFKITYWLRLTVPNYNMLIIDDVLRAGTKRIHGLDGSASQTASRFVFLFFISLWYTIESKKLHRYIPIILIFIGLVLVQTRAAFIAIFISIIYIIIILIIKKLTTYKIISNIYKSIIILLISITVSPMIKTIFNNFINNSLFRSISTYDSSIEVKVNRIPTAIEYAGQKLFTGYGSREYAYYEIMMTDDLPTQFIYLLSGGIFLLLTHLFVYLYPIYKTFSVKSSNLHEKRYFIFISAALLAGFIMTTSNWLETHRMIMVMVFIASLKYLSIKNINNLNI